MSSTPRRPALLVLGLVLLTAPFWAPPLDVTGPTYEYSAALVTVEDNRVDIPRDRPLPESLPTVDCFPSSEPSRLCAFEAGLIASGSLEAPYPGVRNDTGDPSPDAPARYVAFPGDGRVFERTTTWNASANASVLELERVNATQVLAAAARPVDEFPYPVRQAVETGSARADEPLSESVLVASSGRDYAVYTTGTRTTLPESPLAERALEVLAVLAGALLLWRARGAYAEDATAAWTDADAR